MNPSAILVGDMHLSDQTPICRTDDFVKARNRKVKFVKRLQDKYKIPVIQPGDVFDHWKPSPELLRWAIETCPTMLSIPGQHDLPNHAFAEYNRSGHGVLEAAGKIQLVAGLYKRQGFTVTGFPWASPLEPLEGHTDDCRAVAVAHYFTYMGKKPFPGITTPHMASSVLRKLAGFDLVLTGDNHQSFVYEHEGRVLVNPGSMLRTTASQENHEPCIYLWDAKTNGIEKVLLPFEKGVISREHIDILAGREERTQALMDGLEDVAGEDAEWDIQGFEERMEAYILQTPDIGEDVLNKLYLYTAQEGR